MREQTSLQTSPGEEYPSRTTFKWCTTILRGPASLLLYSLRTYLEKHQSMQSPEGELQLIPLLFFKLCKGQTLKADLLCLWKHLQFCLEIKLRKIIHLMNTDRSQVIYLRTFLEEMKGFLRLAHTFVSLLQNPAPVWSYNLHLRGQDVLMLGASGLRAKGHTVAEQPEPAGSSYGSTRPWERGKGCEVKVDKRCAIY